ncbi:MAG: TetR family transcriptional regulator [Tepidisphaera sp.]|nr:TetR family transcriptional regulator [Tepidisphaera sp.]
MLATRTQQTRERILEAAESLFCARGIHSVGVDEVVSRSGVAKMTLYKHFESKDTLVAAVMARKAASFEAWFAAEVAARSADPVGRLLACFDVYAAWFETPEFRGCPFINATAELSDPAHPARNVAMSHKRAMLELLTEMCKAARVQSPRQLAEQWLLLLDGASAEAMLWQSPVPAARARQIARALLDHPGT